MAKSKIAWDEAASAAANARRLLPEMTAAYFAEGRALMKIQPGAKEMHAFRLRTKRFRYTLEMFRPVYGPSLDKYVGALRKVQTYLGDINDCAAARARLEGALPPESPERAKVDAFLHQRGAVITAEFLEFWRTDFDAEGREPRWRKFLARSYKKADATAARAPAPPS